jgi:hypothetical protein
MKWAVGDIVELDITPRPSFSCYIIDISNNKVNYTYNHNQTIKGSMYITACMNVYSFNSIYKLITSILREEQ